MTHSGDLFCLLAKFEWQVQGQPIGKLPGLLMADVLIIVGVGLLLLLSLMLLFRYSYNRRPKKKHRDDARRVYRGGIQQDEEEDSEAESQDSRRRYKYRWKRRDHRVRNPTLAESGGLPPPRPGEPTQTS